MFVGLITIFIVPLVTFIITQNDTESQGSYRVARRAPNTQEHAEYPEGHPVAGKALRRQKGEEWLKGNQAARRTPSSQRDREWSRAAPNDQERVEQPGLRVAPDSEEHAETPRNAPGGHEDAE